MHFPSFPPRLRALIRLVAWAGVATWFAFGLLVLALRHFVLPGIEGWRGDIERTLSQTLAQPVAIRAIDAGWRGLRPSLHIRGLEIRDAEGRPALGFEDVEADLAWSSLWRLRPHFARLVIDAPTLDLRRDAGGRLFIAGLEVKADEQAGDDFPAWLLAQDRIVIRDAAVSWHDELRGAPPLTLARLNFDLRNSGSHHRFGLTAEPPKALAARLDIRGDFTGRDLDALMAWTGEAYAELDYADLAGWRAWVDYPVELPRGSGGLRLWLNFAQKSLTGVTADVRLVGVAARFSPDLPMLEMDSLGGRLAARRLDDGFALQARQLALATREVHVAPTDLAVEWRPATGTRPARGEASADGLDIGALAALAAYLPLEAGLRERLGAFGPRGRVHDLRLSWRGEPEALAGFSLKARFEDLGLNARGVVPGFAGFDGWVEGNEKGGVLELASRDAVIELPAVFPESRMNFAVLDAKGDWKMEGGALEAQLRKASFQNADAAGEASGRYRGTATEPGEIDLSAKLTRAVGDAVWRYMPLVVNRDTRDWLKKSIVGGKATATLRLKGDLRRFPFRDGSGVFEVKGPFQGAALDYAPGWPGFQDVSGDLEFVGPRMVIRARKARLWGVQLADVKAEIPDLDTAEMTVTGTARGPTADFLRFIEASPVGDRIDHFTEDMKSGGNGELRLRLDMPLYRIADSRVDGRYRLLGNSLTYDDDLPPLSEINGDLHFTGSGIDARKIRAVMLGAPMSVDVGTEEGRVTVRAAGTMTATGLRQQLGHPLFDHLSGSASWTGVVRVKKRSPEVRIEATLQGISSSLPAPFNKPAGETLPLVFERVPAPEAVKTKKPPAERDQLKVSLGDAARVQLLRRQEDGKAVVERGLITVGRPDARLPERGVLLAVKLPRLDADFWRRALARGEGRGNGNAPAMPVTTIDLATDELFAFGRPIHGLQLFGSLDGSIWKMDLRSREASGRLEWDGRGSGRLSGRLARLDLPEGSDTGPATGDADERLPAIDLSVERFLLHGHEIGELWIEAENADGLWNARFDARNEDGGLEGTGRWQPANAVTRGATDIRFKLTAKSIEGMLRQFGYPGAIRRGKATLDGNLSWAGAPTAIDYASLGGKLRLEASNGQFNKLEPGVGRLLGILSLQSLPRRITLDFRDIFSEGFAFDTIAGEMTVSQGILNTGDFQIQGPAAKVLMNGTVDLGHETQDLKVRVQPALGESVATGVLLVHPAVGAAAWLMNKVFGNPLDKAFAFDYAVTGSWADPKVEKVAAQGPAQGPAYGPAQ